MISELQTDIMLLARALSRGGEDFDSTALIAAEAEIDLLRIRKYRAALIEEARGQEEPSTSNLADMLNKLERYERRAFSRRNKALRANDRHDIG